MKKTILPRLKALNSEVLAQALFDLANQTDEAKVVVDRLTRTSDEAHKSTKRAISALKRSSRFIDWSNIHSFVRKLDNIVEDISQIDASVEQRFDLICRFFETDQSTFDRVDDSSGYVGDVYRISAQTVFTECAAIVAATNQPLIADELELLLSSNDYGVRDTLLDAVVVHLDDATNRALIVRFSTRSDQEADSYVSVAWLQHVMTIASHLGDTRLFEITALESVAEFDIVPTHTKFSIASNYFKNNDFEKTKHWMEEIASSEHFMLTERNQLLVALHDKLGNDRDRDRIALEQFKRAPSLDALEILVSTIGEQKRSVVVDEQVNNIFADTEFSDDSLAFLIDTGFLDLASDYTVRNHASINGDHYWQLPKNASHFSKSGYPLAAICIYRALLDSILRRGKTKTYSYGVRYLSTLDQLSETSLVEGVVDHATYKTGIQLVHGKKRSFWAKYDYA